MKIKNPKLTLTVGDNVTGYRLVLDDNNKLVGTDIVSSGTYETVAYRSYFGSDRQYKFLGADFDQSVEISDAVNCTLEQGIFIIITDPTKDASCTISFNASN